MRSPAPLVKPVPRPPFREYLEGFNLRQCECRKDWEALLAGGETMCVCRDKCPAHVTPEWLTQAKGQALCSLAEHTGFNCYAECAGESGDVRWYAQPCGKEGRQCDPPILKERAARAVAAEQAKVEQAKGEQAKPQQVAEEPKPAAPAPQDDKMKEKFAALGYDPREVYDLRGLGCQRLNGQERCYVEDSQGRELCPPHVTAEYLANPHDQYLCSSEMADKYYCTVGCQEGSDEVRWGAHEIAWCDQKQNAGSCPPKPSVIPKASYKLKDWDAPVEQSTPCRDAAARGDTVRIIPDLTMGMLTHEPKSMRDSLATYEKLGLFHLTDEFLVYINKRRPEVEAELKPYVDKYGKKIKIMGDESNHGIARGMIYLTSNASHPYFLFLERDFQLIEPATCAYEQLTTGIQLVKSKKADVVRFRHRRHPGRPNWAEKMFKGHEDDAWKGRQPNLFCNVYYWYEDPDKRWPDKIWRCNDDPLMYCSDSYYCNWTNNPQLWYIPWWNREYVERFDSFKRNDPYHDLEVYMNWEPNSWNDRKFTVAQGAGLFKHVDRGNFGV